MPLSRASTRGRYSCIVTVRRNILVGQRAFTLAPRFEDNEVFMNENEPSSAQAQEKRAKAKAEKAAKMASIEEASAVFLKSKQDQLGYLIQATLRIEKGLATLTQNQESLERIIETKFYDLDLKVTEIQTAVEQLQEEAEEKRGQGTTDAFQRVPRSQRSATVPVPDMRATSSASAATASVPPPAATPPAPATSTDAFVLGVLSTPPPEDQA